MAEGKKKVIFYADWIDKFIELEDEEAGKLIKHFVKYINDMNPEAPDRLTKLMFIDIKSTLKRDLDKWNEKSPQRSEKARKAGLASAAARKLKKQLNSTNELKKQLNPTKSTVSVSVSVSDTVSVNDILLEKETKEIFKTWIDYRKEIKKPLKSEKTIISLARKIKKEGFEKSKKVINSSITNGWQGLFWDKATEVKKTFATNR